MVKAVTLIGLLLLGTFPGLSHLFTRSRDAEKPESINTLPTPPETVTPCDVPDVEIIPTFDEVKPGETIVFEVISTNSDILKSPFKWSVSKGKIVSGQGTKKIWVLTSLDLLATPTPSPTPDKLNGYLWISRERRPKIPLDVTVTIEGNQSCTRQMVSVTVFVGTRTLAHNWPGVVESVNLNSDIIALGCKYDANANPNESSDAAVIKITTIASDLEDDVLTYNYTVSGGKIIGTGANLKWDLKGEKPGDYKLTVGVDDGCGLCGKTVTKTVRVSECSK